MERYLTIRKFAKRVIRCVIVFGFLAGGALIADSEEIDPVQAREHWAFQAIKNPPWPAVKDAAWPLTSIDFFILSRMEAAGLRPLPAADKATLIRRATYDLTGLPPTYGEVQEFIADDSSSAFEKVVDRLLASPSYGERWGRHWLDVVRYADTAGETADYPVPVAWRYRNYVIDAFNNDKPYDEFLKEQIAGDILAQSGPREKYAERVIATGFLALSRRFGYDSENYHHLTIQDTLDTLGQATLGLSLGCARCHNHKYDPIPAADYYALYGIFESTRYSFPGSEQKQRRRALAPLVPPEESRAKWREFNARVAFLAQKLQKLKQPVPSAVLLSLDDMDGDFEMQAPAAGGSRGVLVPPWLYHGDVSAGSEAQSPFQNVYPKGNVGVVMPASSNSTAAFFQSIHVSRSDASQLSINFDFRVMGTRSEVEGVRRFWIGSGTSFSNSVAAFEIILSNSEIRFRDNAGEKVICALKPGEWQNLQLTLEPKTGSLKGVAGTPQEVTSFAGSSSTAWNGRLDMVVFSTDLSAGGTAPEMQIDNVAIQQTPILPVSMALPSADRETDGDILQKRLRKIVGIDGGFEFQTEGSQPSEPWYPGPNSKVKLSRTSQSPFHNVYSAGSVGVHMENSGAYDGFVQALPTAWKADSAEMLHATFDFRCSDQTHGGTGSWRFYLGHGAGKSAAVELFINGSSLFARDGDERIAVAEIARDEWFQVQLALNLKEKTYAGMIGRPGHQNKFTGKFASGWDGVLDHTFIDSYGHLGGPRPALDVDNFAISPKPQPPLDAPPVHVAASQLERDRANLREIKEQLDKLRQEAVQDRKELERLLSEGPIELAYAVAEGTPQDSVIQLRGEPDKRGAVVPRGFLSLIGGGPLPENASGSGRLELAEWLANPENPLTARVMVNRIWKDHFGRGLVATPNDFGLRGQPPTHPELLDHLAVEFIRSGWSIKAMHRLIMLSRTYQQAAGSGTDEAAKVHYQGFERRRLTAEELRDSILFTSGAIDSTPGRAHPFPAPFTWGYSQHGPFNAVYDHDKRSVYLMQQRIKRHPFLALFDGADPNTSVPDRRTTTVPTQALFFLNDPFVHEKAKKLSADLLAIESGNDLRIEILWQKTLARSPSPDEKREALDFLQAYRAELASRENPNPDPISLAALTRTLFGNNEFLHID